jgi:hypothetical protein
MDKLILTREILDFSPVAGKERKEKGTNPHFYRRSAIIIFIPSNISCIKLPLNGQ